MGSGSAVCYNNKNNIKILGKMAKTWRGMVAGARQAEGMRGILKVLWQVGILFAVCFLAQGAVELLPFAFPASVLAMVFVFLLLLTGILKKKQIKDLADWFSQNMAFLFVPYSVGIIQYFDLIRQNLFGILFISAVTMLFTFAATGWAVKGLMRLQLRLERGHEHG